MDDQIKIGSYSACGNKHKCLKSLLYIVVFIGLVSNLIDSILLMDLTEKCKFSNWCIDSTNKCTDHNSSLSRSRDLTTGKCITIENKGDSESDDGPESTPKAPLKCPLNSQCYDLLEHKCIDMESGKHSIDSLGDCIISIENTEQTDVANCPSLDHCFNESMNCVKLEGQTRDVNGKCVPALDPNHTNTDCQSLDHCLNENDECVRLGGKTRDVNGKCVTALDSNHTNTNCQSLDHCLNENDECVMLGGQTRDVNGKCVPAPDPNHTNTDCQSLDHCLNENDECVMLEGQLRSDEGKCQRSDLLMCPDKHCIDKSSLIPQCRPLDNTLRLSPTNGECLCVIESQELFDGKCQCPLSSCTLSTDLQCLDLSAASTTFDTDLQPEEKAIVKNSTTGFCECQGADLPTIGGTSSSTSNYYIHPSLLKCETFCQGLIDPSKSDAATASSDEVSDQARVCLAKANTVLKDNYYVCAPGFNKVGETCIADSTELASQSKNKMIIIVVALVVSVGVIISLTIIVRKNKSSKTAKNKLDLPNSSYGDDENYLNQADCEAENAMPFIDLDPRVAAADNETEGALEEAIVEQDFDV